MAIFCCFLLSLHDGRYVGTGRDRGHDYEILKGALKDSGGCRAAALFIVSITPAVS